MPQKPERKPSRRLLVIVTGGIVMGVLALLLMPAGTTSADSQPKQRVQRRNPKPNPGSKQAIRAFMRQKLDSMKFVLRGIVTDDYDLIRKNAVAMQTMGIGVEWNIVQGPIYGTIIAPPSNVQPSFWKTLPRTKTPMVRC